MLPTLTLPAAAAAQHTEQRAALSAARAAATPQKLLHSHNCGCTHNVTCCSQLGCTSGSHLHLAPTPCPLCYAANIAVDAHPVIRKRAQLDWKIVRQRNTLIITYCNGWISQLPPRRPPPPRPPPRPSPLPPLSPTLSATGASATSYSSSSYSSSSSSKVASTFPSAAPESVCFSPWHFWPDFQGPLHGSASGSMTGDSRQRSQNIRASNDHSSLMSFAYPLFTMRVSISARKQKTVLGGGEAGGAVAGPMITTVRNALVTPMHEC